MRSYVPCDPAARVTSYARRESSRCRLKRFSYDAPFADVFMAPNPSFAAGQGRQLWNATSVYGPAASRRMECRTYARDNTTNPPASTSRRNSSVSSRLWSPQCLTTYARTRAGRVNTEPHIDRFETSSSKHPLEPSVDDARDSLRRQRLKES